MDTRNAEADTEWSHRAFISVEQCFSYMHTPWNHPESLLKCNLLGPTPLSFRLISILLMWGPEFQFLTNSHVLLMLLILGPQFGNSSTKGKQCCLPTRFPISLSSTDPCPLQDSFCNYFQ